MNNFTTLLKRETMSFWYSPMAYILWAIFLSLCGYTFVSNLLLSMQSAMAISPTNLLFGRSIWIMLPLLATALTMRLLAEEKRMGTLESLLTAPVSDVEVVLSKFASALLNSVVILAPTFTYLHIVASNSSGLVLPAAPVFAASAAIIFLQTACLISIGLLLSSWTQHQVIAAITILCATLLLMFTPEIMNELLFSGQTREIARAFEPIMHVTDYTAGRVTVIPPVLYLSLTVFFLYLTTQSLESRRWK